MVHFPISVALGHYGGQIAKWGEKLDRGFDSLNFQAFPFFRLCIPHLVSTLGATVLDLIGEVA